MAVVGAVRVRDAAPGPIKQGPVEDGPVAVIDIGSNSIRLVVYDALSRAPMQVFNDKAACELARGMDKTGRLNPEGVQRALTALARFRHLIDAMGARIVLTAATAAARDALDGKEFLARVREVTGLSVIGLPGEEEARLSAVGVGAAFPGAQGVMGDLGGGSLELVAMPGGVADPGLRVTLPLGLFRLGQSGGDRQVRDQRIAAALADIGWLSGYGGHDFFAVGGSWRALARAHLGQSDHPLHIIHAYAVAADEMAEFTRLLAVQSPMSLERIEGVSKRRAQGLPIAAQVMGGVIEALRPKRVVFSAYGLREGLVIDRVAEAARDQDPLLLHCRHLAERFGRVATGPAVAEWIGGLLANEDPDTARLRLAACWLNDVGREFHPDYRAEQACQTVLRMPCVGIDHPGRAWLATATYSRYAGLDDRLARFVPVQLLSDAQRRDAVAIGLAVRLAHSLCGGSVELLAQSSLTRRRRSLGLAMAGDFGGVVAETVERRLADLAGWLNLTASVRITPKAAKR